MASRPRTFMLFRAWSKTCSIVRPLPSSSAAPPASTVVGTVVQHSRSPAPDTTQMPSLSSSKNEYSTMRVPAPSLRAISRTSAHHAAHMSS